jgi:hypothetical protein
MATAPGPVGPVPYLKEPSGILGLFAPNRAREPNQARQIINWFVANRPELAEEVIRQYGGAAGLGPDLSRFQETFAGPGRRVAEAMRLQQPTDVPGPVGQPLTAPGLAGPPSLSRATFGPEQQFPMQETGALPPQPDVPLPPVQPQRPAKYPAQPPYPYPLEGVRHPTVSAPWITATAPDITMPGGTWARPGPAYPEAPVGPDERGEFRPPTLPEPREFEERELPATVGGATAEAPTPVQYDITKVTRPGMTAAEIFRTRPDLASTMLSTMPKVQEAIDAETGMRATEDYQRAVTSEQMTQEEALEQFGPDMQRWPTGQKIVAQAEKSLVSQATRTKAKLEAAEKETKAKREEENRQFLMQRAEELRATDPDGAFQAELIARDPKMAEEWRQYQEQRTKATELKKPQVFEGQPYVAEQDPTTGQMVMRHVPGVPQKAEKPWWDGKSRPELIAIAGDPTIDPGIRKQARAAADELQTGAEKAAAAGVQPPPKPTQESEKQAGQRVVMLRALDQVAQMATANPDWIGGSAKPLTAWKYAAAYDAWDPLKGVAALLANVPPGYDTFRANLGMFTAEKLHELAGSALTPGELARYGAFLPNVYQSEARFKASVLVGRQMLIGASQYYEARQTGKSIPEAQQIARDAIEAAYQEGVKQYGAPERLPPKTAAEFKGRKAGQ